MQNKKCIPRLSFSNFCLHSCLLLCSLSFFPTINHLLLHHFLEFSFIWWVKAEAKTCCLALFFWTTKTFLFFTCPWMLLRLFMDFKEFWSYYILTTIVVNETSIWCQFYLYSWNFSLSLLIFYPLSSEISLLCLDFSFC